MLKTIFIFIVGILHVWFMILESFLWTKPLGRKTFRLSPEQAAATKSLAQNQGLYNGFLAAGLFWGAIAENFQVSMFFLSCVILAGIVGGFTVSKKIIFVQSLPALIAMALLLGDL